MGDTYAHPTDVETETQVKKSHSYKEGAFWFYYGPRFTLFSWEAVQGLRQGAGRRSC